MPRDSRLKVGDSVIVKAGMKDPDMDTEIGGWQGRLIVIEDDMVDIAWDSVTLRNMPGPMIEQCELEGLDWAVMRLETNEVTPTKARDTKSDVNKTKQELASQHQWVYLGEEGKRIQKVLAGGDADDIMEALAAWRKYLEATLVFPFEAIVAESQERGPMRMGDKVKVTGINQVEDDLYGLIADLRVGHRKYAFPLCDLEVTDKASANYQPVRDYVVWFANR